jgi:hypothetical protein
MEIISFAINLEHMGDIIDKNLSELATKKIKRRFQFSLEGAEELSTFRKRTTDSLRIAFGVFVSGDSRPKRISALPHWGRPRSRRSGPGDRNSNRPYAGHDCSQKSNYLAQI